MVVMPRIEAAVGHSPGGPQTRQLGSLGSMRSRAVEKKYQFEFPFQLVTCLYLFIIQFNFQHTFQTVRMKNFLVFQKTFSRFEPLGAIITLELWQSMAQFMLFKICCSSKRFATLVTFEGFFSSVNSHMTSHVGSITHSNATYATFMPVNNFTMSSEINGIFFYKLNSDHLKNSTTLKKQTYFK